MWIQSMDLHPSPPQKKKKERKKQKNKKNPTPHNSKLNKVLANHGKLVR